jgi:hypothetical protein
MFQPWRLDRQAIGSTRSIVIIYQVRSGLKAQLPGPELEAGSRRRPFQKSGNAATCDPDHAVTER